MGMFDMIGGLLNGDTIDELSAKVTQAVDGLQATLDSTAQATENGIQQVETATERVDTVVPGPKN